MPQLRCTKVTALRLHATKPVADESNGARTLGVKGENGHEREIYGDGTLRSSKRPDPGGMVDSRDAAELLQVFLRAAATAFRKPPPSTPPDASKWPLSLPVLERELEGSRWSCSSGARCHQNRLIDTTCKDTA